MHMAIMCLVFFFANESIPILTVRNKGDIQTSGVIKMTQINTI